MNWYYALGTQQSGPVSDSQLDDLLRSGKITGATLVWREGMADWQPLSEARLGAATPPDLGMSSGLCEKYRTRRQRGLIIGWSSFAIGLILLIGGITGAIMAITVSAAKITKENVWVTGVHRDFLAQLPEWHGP